MKKVFNRIYILIIALSLVTFSCADLEVLNEIAPDASRALANPSDVMALAGGGFRTFHNATQEYDGLALAMGVMSDNLTCSWGNGGMRDLSWEPRINGFNNSLTYSYFGHLQHQWQEYYGAISAVNLVLERIDEDMQFGNEGSDNELVEAWCYFVSGISHGYLGLVYDQANVIPHGVDVTTLELLPWSQVIDSALIYLDKAIALADGNVFDIPLKWTAGVTMNNEGLSELANGYAARILASSSRNKAHNDAIDWTQVLTYAQNGLTFDFTPEIGDAYDWYDMYKRYGRLTGWVRIDHRIINEMDHDYPSRWPTDGIWPDGDPGPAADVDHRVVTDFEYLSSNAFPPDRGYYHFSHYRHSRYDDVFPGDPWYGVGATPSFLSWECKLLEAEALYRTGNPTGAVDILNDPAGPRKVRGMLPDVNGATDDVFKLILAEKDVECLLTGSCIPFFDMRRTDRLQPQTLLHFPVPATELEISGLPIYTISNTADGIDGSAGDWIGFDLK